MTKRSAILYVFTAVTFWLPLTLKANFQFLGNVQSFHQQQNQLILNCGVPQVQITVLAPDLIRIRMTSNGHFPEDHSYAVVKTDWPATEPSVQDSPHEIVITTAELVLRINKSPCRLAFYDQAGNLINKDYPPFGMGWDGDKITCWKEMTPDEKFYGLGEKVGGINKRGHTWVMWNTDAFGYTDITDPLYQSHPFFLGLRQGRGYGIFFDNTYRSEFRLASGTDEFYSFGADGGEMNYYFFYGPGLKKILTRFTELVGRMPLPPKWALGYQQCRWSYYPESEVRRIARTFREKQIPCDVIYLDIHYMDGYRCFTWDKQRFPDPKKLLADLEAMGFKVVVIIDPGIKVDPGYWVHDQGLAGDHFCKYPDGRLYVGQVWPGNCYFPDFTRPETRFWWGSLYTQLLEQGVDGFWNDMNEPAVWGGTFPDVVQHHDFGQTVDHSKIHNVYGLEMARGTYEGNLRLRPDRRPFVLTRAGFTGVQRYAAVWTGDNTATWNHLSLCLPMCLSLGLVGVPFVGYDIGGFSGSPSPELYSRWLQLGSFTPLCRTHSALGTAAQEPWVYGDDFETINRNFIQKRYKLLPYLYDAFHEASISGLPVMKPLVLEYQQDERTHEINDQFLLGEDLLIAPVLTEGTRLRKVYLPEGEWYNFWNNEKYPGPGLILVEAPLELMPILVKAGAILPLQETMNYVGEKPVDPLILTVYLAPAATDSLYEDAGDGFEYKKGLFCYTPYRLESKKGQVAFTIGNRSGQFKPPERNYLLKFIGLSSYATNPQDKLNSVLMQGKILPPVAKMEELMSQLNVWYYDRQADALWLRFPDTGQEIPIKINLK